MSKSMELKKYGFLSEKKQFTKTVILCYHENSRIYSDESVVNISL